jgi:predicted RNA-binding Zn-ribbon protein involved in translation (DUF1610 family)
MAAVSSGAVILEDDGSRVTLQYICVSCGRAQPGTTNTSQPGPNATCEMSYRCYSCGNQNRFILFGS